ncbi:seed linoleate 9S-lipoxygenase-2 isoform X2 [Vigna umbellata]|uniref:seed linoleate 9S-lipoxygenase-2 isoform X2 n=1 Tax=Vigna umbellata TaxID=87088 RepID=UPI001F5E8118|nr:seed linoleate 9S-lipoxygenase-2 isoform X2 [Vigna umbellata]
MFQVPKVPGILNPGGVSGILNPGGHSQNRIKGTVVLMRKNVLDFNSVADFTKGNVGGVIGTGLSVVGSTVDGLTAFLGRSVSLQLISATKSDESGKGKVGKDTFIEGIITSLPTLGAGESAFYVHFEWDESMGIPGAFYVKNFMQVEFYLKSLTLEDVPNHGTIRFVCNSWIYNTNLYKKRLRIFFANHTYVPSETPKPLVHYREEELKNLRGDGTGERKEHDRIYDYDVYNDLGNPDLSENFARPILGGSSTHPYPRRGRTGRYPTRKDSNCEKPGEVYVPRDENFGHLKSSDFLAYGIKSLSQYVLPAFESMFSLNLTPNEFDSFQDVRDLCEGGIKLPTEVISSIALLPVIKELFRTDGEQVLKFPTPHVIKVNKSAWMTDEEFAREMIAGVNPNVIRGLEEFPPKSNLDPATYGDQNSKITAEALDLEGSTVDEALAKKRLFVLDYHDIFMPYIRGINQTYAKAYATRTILFLKENGTLMPVAIELSLPHPAGDKSGAVSQVILPAKEGVESTIWLLAKAYVVVNDSCYHQLMSHWLNTHAVMEPFIIATHRHLSALHPIYKLLTPHYRDTMNINALARQSLINADGIIEKSFLPSKYSVEMSSAVYKNWVFTDQALPAELVKRGVAVKDSSAPHGLRLLIEDYPYAVDGLEIWAVIKSWVQEYVSLYYAKDDDVKSDPELQHWWKEAVEKGHADLKDKPWWPKLQTLEELVEICTIIIWTGSALHAAVNFGQYPYGGFILNRPTSSRRLLPEKGTPEYEEMVNSHQKAYLRTITSKFQTMIDLSVIEILSRHASDEVYLGQRENPHWTSDSKALKAFQKFGNKLKDIEEKLASKNKDEKLRNRIGPVELPYTLLHPTSEEGLTFRGIPNSISI